MADSCVASVCASGVSMVSALAAAVCAIEVHSAAHYLDAEHYPDIHRLASAGTRTSVGAPWLGSAAGIRIRCNDCCNHPVAPHHPVALKRLKVEQASRPAF